jgi:hypothetical protein
MPFASIYKAGMIPAFCRLTDFSASSEEKGTWRLYSGSAIAATRSGEHGNYITRERL